MNFRRASTGTSGALTSRHLMRRITACAIAAALLAALPRPAAGFDQMPNEDAAMAMVLLLSLGQALSPKSDAASQPASTPESKSVPVAAIEPAAATGSAEGAGAAASDASAGTTGAASTGVDPVAPAGQ